MAEDAVFVLCICHTFCVECVLYDECFAILSIVVFCVTTYFNIFYFFFLEMHALKARYYLLLLL